MSSFLQVLRLAFWRVPLQRALTVVGLLLVALAVLVPRPFYLLMPTMPATLFGATLVFITPTILGGALLRAVSAPRILRLIPYGRLQLLVSAIGIAVLAALFWVAIYWLVLFNPRFALKAPDALALVTGVLLFASSVGLGGFIASHSPAGMLLALALWLVPGARLRRLGLEEPNAYLWGWRGLVWLAVWAAFGIWYLRARRIAPPGWLLPSGQAVFATSSVVSLPPRTRLQGIDRLLLGGSAIGRIALQWLLAASLLVAVQVALAQLNPTSEPRIVVAMLFATLSVSSLVIGARGFEVTRRSRALWLVAGLTRDALFQRCEWLMLRVVLMVGLSFGLLLALIWLTLAPHPPWQPSYLAASLALPGVAAAWLGLAHVRAWTPVDVIAGLALFAGWYYGTLLPLLNLSVRPSWTLLAVELVGILALRMLASARWKRVEWPRPARHAA